MILNRIHVNKNWDLNEIKKLIIYFSALYINAFFKSRFKNKQELKRLSTIENYIKDTYKINLNIKKIILYMFLNIEIDNKGFVNLMEFKLKGIKGSFLYKTITFGTLTTPKSTIIDDALSYGIKLMKVRKIYGR